MASTERIGLDLDSPLAKILNEKQYLWHILDEKTAFPTVKRLSDCNFPNILDENKVGKYKAEADRKIVTTDLGLIEKFIEMGSGIPYFSVAGPRKNLIKNPKDLRVGIVNAGGVAPGLNCVINAIVNRHFKYGLDTHNRVKGYLEFKKVFSVLLVTLRTLWWN